MSLILDALRKSDRQRARHASERLREGPLPARASSIPAWLGMMLLTAIVLAATGLFLLRHQETASRTATGAASEIMENGPAETTRARVRDLASELAPVPKAAQEPVPLTQREAPSRNSPPDAEAPDPEALNAPPLAALPADVREQLPELQINVHAWAADPDARFVLINLRRYKEGDRLQEGPVVRQILRGGVVLDFRGRLFSLPRN